MEINRGTVSSEVNTQKSYKEEIRRRGARGWMPVALVWSSLSLFLPAFLSSFFLSVSPSFPSLPSFFLPFSSFFLSIYFTTDFNFPVTYKARGESGEEDRRGAMKCGDRCHRELERY